MYGREDRNGYDDRDQYSDRGGDGERLGRPMGRPGGLRRRKVCRFCTEKDAVIDYRDPGTLKYFISERGKVVPRRISGTCSRHQRELGLAIKRARILALVPFTIV